MGGLGSSGGAANASSSGAGFAGGASFDTGERGGWASGGVNQGGNSAGNSQPGGSQSGGFGATGALAGAGSNVAGSDAGGQPVAECDECLAAKERIGRRACVCRITDEELWNQVTIRVLQGDAIRGTKYTLPAKPSARLPGLFTDANAFTLHLDFLQQAFPDSFANLSGPDYLRLIFDPRQREFYVGSIAEYLIGGEVVLYGFTIWDDPADPTSTVDCAQARNVYQQLDARFDLTPLAFVPSSLNQRNALANCDLPSFDPELGVAYEAYTEGVAYGTLRRIKLTELSAATNARSFGWRDVLVLDQAPADLETIISGAVTGTAQGALSHLNVRSAARGTPNCYLNDAYNLLSAWEGKLVRLECGASYWSVEEATPERAEAFWATLRPPPVVITAPDLDWSTPSGLLQLPTDSVEARELARRRYGAKGANLSILYQRFPSQYQMPGFLIPFRYYSEFMRNHGWSVDLGAGPQSVSFADTMSAWLADPSFRTDAALRASRLASLRSAMEGSPIELDLSSAIQQSFGTDSRMLRFRSSSNVEDALAFNGAGLYESASGCLADDLDGDEIGPSRCDPTESKERTVRRALTRVWASLWTPEAYDERDWYSIDQRLAVMGVLVDPRAKDEQANFVAFSGNPTTAADNRYLVNAQPGDYEVVSADPGIFPEADLLTLDNGQVSAIERVRGSSQLSPGTWVLSDEQLRTLGNLLWQITQSYPLDEGAPSKGIVLLDTEWKILADGQWVVKQVRPFLKKQ